MVDFSVESSTCALRGEEDIMGMFLPVDAEKGGYLVMLRMACKHPALLLYEMSGRPGMVQVRPDPAAPFAMADL